MRAHEEEAMTVKVKPIPDGWQGATPYLCVKDPAGALEF
jgi:hypothetical protein